MEALTPFTYLFYLMWHVEYVSFIVSQYLFQAGETVNFVVKTTVAITTFNYLVGGHRYYIKFRRVQRSFYITLHPDGQLACQSAL
jgi:hypothetical protein